MSLYFKTFARIYIYAFTTIHVNQLKCTQAFNLHILIALQRFFNQLEKFFHEALSIRFIHAMLFGKQFY